MSSYAYTVYRGTFIQLPRQLNPKLELICNHGALWVSTEDGRIKGCDWHISDDSSFQTLMNRNGWVDVNASTNGDNGTGTPVKVKIVVASKERNEFFFPGFIGKFSPSD